MKKQILDQGYLEYIEHWGSDERIIESARMSTGKGFLGWGPKVVCTWCESEDCQDPRHEGDGSTKVIPGDEKLLRYLWQNKHQTPFEMAGLTIEVMAPIMVFREWHRHRVPFGYNEMSARYTPLPDVNYLPTTDRLLVASDGKNRQTGTVAGAEVLDLDSALAWLASLADVYEHCERVYQDGLRRGVPKELARLCVPVGRYSRMRATSNLRGWLAFLSLRMPKSAQYEIRVYADAVGELIAEHFPGTWALFAEGRNA